MVIVWELQVQAVWVRTLSFLIVSVSELIMALLWCVYIVRDSGCTRLTKQEIVSSNASPFLRFWCYILSTLFSLLEHSIEFAPLAVANSVRACTQFEKSSGKQPTPLGKNA